MSEQTTAVAVLSRALDQFLTVLEDVPADRLAASTPCSEWTVGDLVDHVVQDPASFAAMIRREKVDWTQPTPHQGEPVTAYRRHVADLLRAWEANPDAQPGPDWQSAEIAVHTWDLATALGRSTEDLDAEVAERGLAFLRGALTPERRGSAFGPEQRAPDGANAYERIAAFAGRAL